MLPGGRRSWQLAFSTFALIFCAIWLLHGPVLRLPYFWDEAGYFIPAAHDLLTTGHLIPTTTLSNAHPPLVMIWIAMWWKFSNYTPAVTRTAMLLVAAFGFFGLWKLASRLVNEKVAAVVVILTALYPVVFAQSSLAQLDMPVMAISIWGLYFYLTKRRVAAVIAFALAALAKETALIIPLTIFVWEFACPVLERTRRWTLCLQPLRVTQTLSLLPSALPLASWYLFHYHRTGYVFGNPEYLSYNVGTTLTPLRIIVALGMRFWHVVGYMNLFVLTAVAFVLSREPAVRDDNNERPMLDSPTMLLFFLLVAAHVLAFAIVGGAALARYMVPVIPLVVLLCVATIYRHARHWAAWCALAGVAFVLALVVNPPWRIAPEDNLAYTDFVHLHAAAAAYLQHEHPNATVLTAWPASDELNRPFLGYVKKPMTVVRVENFSAPQILAAAQQRDAFDYIFLFNTKYDPPRNLLTRLVWWNRLQQRYFDYHQDLVPEQVALVMQGRIVWQQQRGGQWAAVIAIEHVQNARLRVDPTSGPRSFALAETHP